jgi:hypothetical protein
MRLVSAVFLSLLVFSACGGSGGGRDSPSTDNAERFPVPDDLVGTKYEMDCDAAKSLVKDRDETIRGAQKFLADPKLRPGTRKYIEKNLIGISVDRAAIVAANPSCFTIAQLKEAHKITDAREKSA